MALKIVATLSKSENIESLQGDLLEKESEFPSKGRARVEFWREILGTIMQLVLNNLKVRLIKILPSAIIKWLEKRLSK